MSLAILRAQMSWTTFKVISKWHRHRHEVESFSCAIGFQRRSSERRLAANEVILVDGKTTSTSARDVFALDDDSDDDTGGEENVDDQDEAFLDQEEFGSWSFRKLEELEEAKEALNVEKRELLKSWCVVALMHVYEISFERFFNWVPGYSLMKFIGVLNFALANKRNSAIVAGIYSDYFAPLMQRFEAFMLRVEKLLLDSALKILSTLHNHHWTIALTEMSIEDVKVRRRQVREQLVALQNVSLQ